MKFNLYYKNKFISTHDDFLDAEAQARWVYFQMNSSPWEEYEMPIGFMISSTLNKESK